MFYCNVNKINQSIFRVNALNSQCRDSSSQDWISPNLNNNQMKHYYICITFVLHLYLLLILWFPVNQSVQTYEMDVSAVLTLEKYK